MRWRVLRCLAALESGVSGAAPGDAEGLIRPVVTPHPGAGGEESSDPISRALLNGALGYENPFAMRLARMRLQAILDGVEERC